MSYSQTLEDARKFLKWSYQDVAMRSSGKYSAEYMEQVHLGRPFSEVGDDLIEIYTEGLAVQAVDRLFRSTHPESVLISLANRFIDLVNRKKLPLGEIRALSESVSNRSFRRLLTMEAPAIFIAWEGVLDEIVRELNKAQQGRLLWDNSRAADISSHSSLVSEVPTIAGGPRRDPLAILAECNFCHKPRPKDRYSKQTCGCLNDDYL